MNFARNFTALRKRMGISQEQMAEKCGVSRAALAKWETGNSTPDIYKVLKISEIFRVSVDELLSGEIDNFSDNTIEGVYDTLKGMEERILAAIKSNKGTGSIYELYRNNLIDSSNVTNEWPDGVPIDAIYYMGIDAAINGQYDKAIDYLEEALSYGKIQAVEHLVFIYKNILEMYVYEEEAEYISCQLEFAKKIQQYGKIMEEEIQRERL